MIIAFLGLGLMGFPMASNLLKAGFKVNVYNRTPAKAIPLAALKAQVFSTSIEAVDNADIIITMFDSEKAQEQVLINPKTLAQCKANCLIIDMASISPSAAIEHANLAKGFQINYIDAPVSGGTQGAEQAKLVIMAGGSDEDLIKAQPIFDVLGSKTVHIGPVGAGQITKCANQSIVGITIGAVSEALLLADQAGLNTKKVREALMGGFAASKVLDQHGVRMIEKNFTPGGTAKVQLKDLNNTIAVANDYQLNLPFTQLANDQYQQLNDNGQQNLDHSALLLLLEKNNKIS